MTEDIPINPESIDHHLVAVIGAGPAGLFASRELAALGAQVILFNRDIKPGGLAEYGIYPEKLKMKNGLRAQFRQILAQENITYCGNVQIGTNGDLTVDALRELGFQALLITVGAQGTKWLGLPGEHLSGVYHAKDLVYHYNQLPPYSDWTFHIGQRVAIVGVGNVMTDIARYLIDHMKVKVVTALARRGPGETKFDKKELEAVVNHLDFGALNLELERCTALMQSLEQDVDAIRAMYANAREKAENNSSPSVLYLQFLSSPTAILGDAHGRVCGLEVEDNTLVVENGEVKARGLGTRHVLDVDTVIFAIGDRVDYHLGLPVASSEYIKALQPRYPQDGGSYEVQDERCGKILEDLFVAGWARKSSSGLVGVARKDGINGAHATAAYLRSLPQATPEVLAQARNLPNVIHKPVINFTDLARLETVELAQAHALGLDDFKFSSNNEMLEAMGK